MSFLRLLSLALVCAASACTSSPTAATDTTTTTTTTTTTSTASSAAPTVSGVSPSSGLNVGGMTVTITGANFTNVSGVSFGGVPATAYTVVSTGGITATVPPSPAGSSSAVTIDVVVSNELGSSPVLAADHFSYFLNSLTRLSTFDTSVKGGTDLVGTVGVAYAAPAGGYSIPLTVTSAPSSPAATIPASVSIAAGFTTGSFTIRTAPVTSQQCYVLQASFAGTQSVAFCVVP